MYMKIKALLLLIVAGFIFQSAGFTQSIAQWRGDNREGIYSGKNLLKVWPENRTLAFMVCGKHW